MSGPFEVVKWAHTAPLAESSCGGCGQPVVYNLAVGFVDHAEAAVDPCGEPWPDAPRPESVRAMFRQVVADRDALRRAGPVLDRIVGGWANVPFGGWITDGPGPAFEAGGKRAAFEAAGRIARGEQ